MTSVSLDGATLFVEYAFRPELRAEKMALLLELVDSGGEEFPDLEGVEVQRFESLEHFYESALNELGSFQRKQRPDTVELNALACLAITLGISADVLLDRDNVGWVIDLLNYRK